jgi:uncharacterized protein (DUF608 family)
MDQRFDRLEDKVETFQDRITENRNDIGWIKGHLKLSMTALLTVVGFMAAALYDILRSPFNGG